MSGQDKHNQDKHNQDKHNQDDNNYNNRQAFSIRAAGLGFFAYILLSLLLIFVIYSY